MLCSEFNSIAQSQPQVFPLSETAPLRIFVLVKAIAAHPTIQVRLVKNHEDWHPDLSGDSHLPPCADVGNVQIWAVLAAALLLWFGSGDQVLAATDARADHYITEVWQVTEGLPGNNVTSVVQTPDGYLWVGTHSGLARFDGVRFEVFDGNTPGLESREIRKLFVDQQGGLWVAMAPGHLARYAAGKFTTFHATGGWSMKPAWSFARGRSNDVMIVDAIGTTLNAREASGPGLMGKVF